MLSFFGLSFSVDNWSLDFLFGLGVSVKIECNCECVSRAFSTLDQREFMGGDDMCVQGDEVYDEVVRVESYI